MDTQFNQKRAIAAVCKQHMDRQQKERDDDSQHQRDINLRIALESTHAALLDELDNDSNDIRKDIKADYVGRKHQWLNNEDIRTDVYTRWKNGAMFVGLMNFGLAFVFFGLFVENVVSVAAWIIATVAPSGLFHGFAGIEYWYNNGVVKRQATYDRAMSLRQDEWDVMEDD